MWQIMARSPRRTVSDRRRYYDIVDSNLISNDAISAADRVEILVLVDNMTDTFVRAGRGRERVATALEARHAELSGKCICCGAHGLSCAVTAWRGDTSHTLLFDTGPEAAVFEQNVERLGFDMGTVEGIVLSHGHWDHCGAMLRALEMIRAGTADAPYRPTCTPTCTEAARSRPKNGSMLPMEDVPTAAKLEEHGAHVVHSSEAQQILDDLFFISGEIPRVTAFETGLPGHHRRTTDGTDWEPDPLLMDERFVAVHVKDKGVVVLTACSHAGVVNVMTHARDCFAGTHCWRPRRLPSCRHQRAHHPSNGRGAARIRAEIDCARHCTGWRAVNALAATFGEAIVLPRWEKLSLLVRCTASQQVHHDQDGDRHAQCPQQDVLILPLPGLSWYCDSVKTWRADSLCSDELFERSAEQRRERESLYLAGISAQPLVGSV